MATYTLTRFQRVNLLISGLSGYDWPKLVILIVEITDHDTGHVVRWKFESNPQSRKHAEEYFCYRLRKLLLEKPGRVRIRCWMTYSPCYACADRLVQLYGNRRSPENAGNLVEMSVKFAFVYKHTAPGMKNREGLRDMTSAGIKVAAMDMSDYDYLGIDRSSPSIEFKRQNINQYTSQRLQRILNETDHDTAEEETDIETASTVSSECRTISI